MMKGVIQGLLFGLLMLSCSKDDAMDPLLATVAVYNGVVGTSNIEVFLDDNRLNTATEVIPLGKMLPHVSIIPGERTFSSIFQVQQQGSEKQSSSHQGTIKSEQSKVVFEEGKFYSLFLFGKGDADPRKKLVEDNLIKPRLGSFKLRVANFRMDTRAAVNFKLFGGAINSAYEVSLEEVTGFVEFPMADYTVTIEGLGGGQENFVVDFKPDDQAVYTVWTWGSARIPLQPDANGNITKYPVTITKHGIQ